MLAKSLWLPPLLCLAIGQGAPEDAIKKDLEQMQGAWVMHALEINGKAVTKIDNTLLKIVKDEYKTVVKGKEPPGFRMKLDPSKEPKWMDMIQTQADGTQKVIKGIYTFENDTFKLCRGLAPEQERPGQFATWPDTNYFVVTWKKQVK